MFGNFIDWNKNIAAGSNTCGISLAVVEVVGLVFLDVIGFENVWGVSEVEVVARFENNLAASEENCGPDRAVRNMDVENGNGTFRESDPLESKFSTLKAEQLFFVGGDVDSFIFRPPWKLERYNYKSPETN